MAKKVPDLTIDQSLLFTALGNAIHVCSGQPTDRADVLVRSLGNIVLTPGDGNDFTLAAGTNAPIGRQVTVAAKTGGTFSASGTADHIAIIDSTNMLLVTTISNSQPVTSGNDFSTSSFKQEIQGAT